MQHNNDHPSIVQNIGGDQNQVVGGNIIHGDAHIHLHGDTHQHQPPGGQEARGSEMVESASSILDTEVEDMLASLNLMSLQHIFREEELTMEDLSKMTRDDLERIGIKKIKHRIAIMEGVQRRYGSAITGIYQPPRVYARIQDRDGNIFSSKEWKEKQDREWMKKYPKSMNYEKSMKYEKSMQY